MMTPLMRDGLGDEDHRLVSLLLHDVGEVKASVENINKTLGKLAQLEVEHLETRSALKRAFTEIQGVQTAVNKLLASHDDRIRLVEIEMPGLKEVRRWVVGLVIACVALLFLSVAKNVIKDAHSEQREAQEVPDGR